MHDVRITLTQAKGKYNNKVLTFSYFRLIFVIRVLRKQKDVLIYFSFYMP